MSDYNRYQAPQSRVDGAGTEVYAKIKWFSVKGRIGRIRYLAYTASVSVLSLLAATILSTVLVINLGSQGVQIGWLLMMAVYAFMFVYSIMLAIRRAHDFNVTGWLSLLTLLPLVNLIFLLIPGTQGANDYGAPPPPNTTANVILALVMFIIMLGGVFAAAGIPAYNHYLQRAHSAQQQVHWP
ncbi:MAG: DUF805 domain-containing protein [Gammaproteobacteria bacterium]